MLARQVARRIGSVLLVVLVLIAWAAPSAFQAGARRFTNRLVAQAEQRGQAVSRYLVDHLSKSLPSPSPSASPRHR